MEGHSLITVYSFKKAQMRASIDLRNCIHLPDKIREPKDLVNLLTASIKDLSPLYLPYSKVKF